MLSLNANYYCYLSAINLHFTSGLGFGLNIESKSETTEIINTMGSITEKKVSYFSNILGH